jgi:hypothetical protein
MPADYNYILQPHDNWHGVFSSIVRIFHGECLLDGFQGPWVSKQYALDGPLAAVHVFNADWSPEYIYI